MVLPKLKGKWITEITSKTQAGAEQFLQIVD
jgi:hypothetical protein